MFIARTALTRRYPPWIFLDICVLKPNTKLIPHAPNPLYILPLSPPLFLATSISTTATLSKNRNTMTRVCFVDEDVGLASSANAEVGFSGNQTATNTMNPLFTRARKSTSYRSLYSISSSSSSSCSPNMSSPRAMRFYEEKCKEPQLPHFLESCFLCKKPLGGNRDIFMYRGDTPFCSDECREEQIEIDDAKEKNRKFTALMKNIRKEKQSNFSPNKARSYQVRASTVAAA